MGLLLLLLSPVQLFVTPQTIAHQAPLSMRFSSKNTGVGCRFQTYPQHIRCAGIPKGWYWIQINTPWCFPKWSYLLCSRIQLRLLSPSKKCGHFNYWGQNWAFKSKVNMSQQSIYTWSLKIMTKGAIPSKQYLRSKLVKIKLLHILSLLSGSKEINITELGALVWLRNHWVEIMLHCESHQ